MTNVLASLLDLIGRWFGDEELQEEPLRDYLASEDYGDLDALELYEAVGLYFDTLPVSAQRQQGDFSREYSTGARVNVAQHVEPPPPPKHGGDWEPVHEYVSYMTNNYTYVEDNDTIVDNSVNTQIQAGDDVYFDQEIDIDSTVVSGDGNLVGDDNVVAEEGGVAVGRDLRDSQVITGENSGLAANQSDVDDVVLGDHNRVVQGSDNAVGFGDGDATHAELRDVTVDRGGAISLVGDAEGRYEDNDVNLTNFGGGNVNVNTGDHGSARQTIDESVEYENVGNTDNSMHIDDSFNEDNSVDIDDSEIGNTETRTDVDIDKSFNTEDNDGVDDSIIVG